MAQRRLCSIGIVMLKWRSTYVMCGPVRHLLKYFSLPKEQPWIPPVINALSVELSKASVSTHATCTKLRHLGVSVVHASLPQEEKLPLSNLLAHSPYGAAERYSDVIKASANVRSSKILTKLIQGQDISPTYLEKPFFFNVFFYVNHFSYCYQSCIPNSLI